MTSIQDYGMKWKTIKQTNKTIKKILILEDDETDIIASIIGTRLSNTAFQFEIMYDDIIISNDKVIEGNLKLYIKDIKSYINTAVIQREEY